MWTMGGNDSAGLLEGGGGGGGGALHLSYLPAALFIVAGVLGNVLVCLSICLEKTLQSVTNYFLLSLSVADLLVSCVVMPFGLVAGLLDRWPLDSVWCNFYVTCDVLACTSSIWHMGFISVGRYMGIRDPLHNLARSGSGSVLIRVVLVWLLALGISSIVTVLGIIDIDNIMPNKTVCAINNRVFFVVGSLLAFFIPMAIMAVTYTLTTVLLRRKCRSGLQHRHVGGGVVVGGGALRRRNDALELRELATGRTRDASVQTPTNIGREMSRVRLRLPLQTSLPADRRGRTAATVLNAERKATKTLGLVFLAFVVCWLPFFTLNIIQGVTGGIDVNEHVEALFLWLGYVSSTINPIIYTSVNKTFRSTFIKLLGCRCREIGNRRLHTPSMSRELTTLSTPLTKAQDSRHMEQRSRSRY